MQVKSLLLRWREKRLPCSSPRARVELRPVQETRGPPGTGEQEQGREGGRKGQGEEGRQGGRSRSRRLNCHHRRYMAWNRRTQVIIV